MLCGIAFFFFFGDVSPRCFAWAIVTGIVTVVYLASSGFCVRGLGLALRSGTWLREVRIIYWSRIFECSEASWGLAFAFSLFFLVFILFASVFLFFHLA